MSALLPLLPVGAAALSWLLIRIARRRALERGALDLPNERSSHTVPTPRIGGVGFIAPALICLAGLAAVEPAWLPAAAALALVAAIGRLDDVRSLPIAPRLAVHAAAGATLALTLGRELPIAAGVALPLGIATLLWTLWTVAAINVVNFMDGIDALIGLTLTVYATFALIALPWAAPGSLLALVLLGGLLAFLGFNRPPARVFMGDAGSGALGLLAVVLGMTVMRAAGWSALRAWLPLAPLFIDEVFTMARRIARGESLARPHRSHAYQELVVAGASHGRVALGFAAAAAACAAWALLAPERGFTAGAILLLALVAAAMETLRRRATRRRHP